MGLKDDLIKKHSDDKPDKTSGNKKQQEKATEDITLEDSGVLDLEELREDALNEVASEDEEVLQDDEEISMNDLIASVGLSSSTEDTEEDDDSPSDEDETAEVEQDTNFVDMKVTEHSYTSSKDTELADKVLQYAQEEVLNDVVKPYKSTLVTEEALNKLVSAYINHDDEPYTNSNAVLSSVIDEILGQGKYDGSHYNGLTEGILRSVQQDLQV